MFVTNICKYISNFKNITLTSTTSTLFHTKKLKKLLSINLNYFDSARFSSGQSTCQLFLNIKWKLLIYYYIRIHKIKTEGRHTSSSSHCIWIESRALCSAQMIHNCHSWLTWWHNCGLMSADTRMLWRCNPRIGQLRVPQSTRYLRYNHKEKYFDAILIIISYWFFSIHVARGTEWINVSIENNETTHCVWCACRAD